MTKSWRLSHTAVIPQTVFVPVTNDFSKTIDDYVEKTKDYEQGVAAE